MRFGGVFAEDAPDPRIELHRRLRDMPVPIVGLIAQPSLEDTDSLGITQERDASRATSWFSVSISYTLWRNPTDRSDPVNLAELDDEKRAAVEMVTPWPRPAWLVEHIQRMRYPQLSEAVRTTWYRDLTGRTDLPRLLVEHVNSVLSNEYRGHAARPAGPPVFAEFAGTVSSATIVAVDGVPTPAVEIDSDPFVYAIGAKTGPQTVVTAVLPRTDLEYVRVAFATRRDAVVEPS